MNTEATGSCITRSDRTVLLECAHPGYEEARAVLGGFAELVKSPPAYHTYRITPLSLWNAAAGGQNAASVLGQLHRLSRWGVPSGLEEEIELLMSRYGSLQLCMNESDPGQVTLSADTAGLLDELEGFRELKELGLVRAGECRSHCPKGNRGLLKQELTRLGYPVLDYAGYRDGQELRLAWKTAGGQEAGGGFGLRDYQQEAVRRFQGIAGEGGSGVVVLPCGAGKTMVGMGVLEKLQCETLILTSSTTSVEQWREELLQRTTLGPADVGRYTGEVREVRPVTVATYQMLTHRNSKGGAFVHMNLFNERNWGLIIYDEVHLLPAPVFRATADIQATRRLGLTATLVREDGREGMYSPDRPEVLRAALEGAGEARVDCRRRLHRAGDPDAAGPAPAVHLCRCEGAVPPGGGESREGAGSRADRSRSSCGKGAGDWPVS